MKKCLCSRKAIRILAIFCTRSYIIVQGLNPEFLCASNVRTKKYKMQIIKAEFGLAFGTIPTTCINVSQSLNLREVLKVRRICSNIAIISELTFSQYFNS